MEDGGQMSSIKLIRLSPKISAGSSLDWTVKCIFMMSFKVSFEARLKAVWMAGKSASLQVTSIVTSPAGTVRQVQGEKSFCRQFSVDEMTS